MWKFGVEWIYINEVLLLDLLLSMCLCDIVDLRVGIDVKVNWVFVFFGWCIFFFFGSIK